MSAITICGVVVLVFMVAMYAMEKRHCRYVAALAAGCALSSSYGFISGAWPSGWSGGVDGGSGAPLPNRRRLTGGD